METFQYVQAEMQRRRELGALANKSLNTCCFTGKLKCPFCGQSYMHNTRKDRGNFQEFWSCVAIKKKGGRCPVGGSINHKHLRESCAKVLGLPEFDEELLLEVNAKIHSVVEEVKDDYDLSKVDESIKEEELYSIIESAFGNDSNAPVIVVIPRRLNIVRFSLCLTFIVIINCLLCDTKIYAVTIMISYLWLFRK